MECLHSLKVPSVKYKLIPKEKVVVFQRRTLADTTLIKGIKWSFSVTGPIKTGGCLIGCNEKNKSPFLWYCHPKCITWISHKETSSLTWKKSCKRTGLRAKSLQSCLTLCDPKDCSLPGSSVHGILQARILEWVAVPFSRICVCIFSIYWFGHKIHSGFSIRWYGKTQTFWPTQYHISGEGNGNPLQYSCLEHSMDRGAW